MLQECAPSSTTALVTLSFHVMPKICIHILEIQIIKKINFVYTLIEKRQYSMTFSALQSNRHWILHTYKENHFFCSKLPSLVAIFRIPYFKKISQFTSEQNHIHFHKTKVVFKSSLYEGYTKQKKEINTVMVLYNLHGEGVEANSVFIIDHVREETSTWKIS